ncbi:hypothetical protein LTR22_001029 [Elasticomyces elasticus]|nr:hypothetical protein LTR22_001029 [Elasticomyces elasticus]KAK5767602.1 hypothetical protein LTS12_002103 [Elasticomyces elasticus]
MRTSAVTSALFGVLAAVQAQEPGYDGYPTCIASTVPSNETISFGRHYAVLNLDLINLLVSGVASTPAGSAWIANVARWNDAVHAQSPAPLSIFTRIYFTNSHQPEIGPSSPFAQVGGALGTAASNLTAIYPAFYVNDTAGDVVLQKTRYAISAADFDDSYAGAGNGLEEILRAQQINTVILSGIRTSGVILSTAYRLFDLDYKVYVIANNTIETPPNTPDINTNILEGILPKLPIDVITIEQALAGLNNSGPAVY